MIARFGPFRAQISIFQRSTLANQAVRKIVNAKPYGLEPIAARANVDAPTINRHSGPGMDW